VVSVGHRQSVEQHHERQLALLGGGAWRLESAETVREG
jgi:putative ATP-binding cassette transporter